MLNKPFESHVSHFFFSTDEGKTWKEIDPRYLDKVGDQDRIDLSFFETEIKKVSVSEDPDFTVQFRVQKIHYGLN